jgi:hypothetical protein
MVPVVLRQGEGGGGLYTGQKPQRVKGKPGKEHARDRDEKVEGRKGTGAGEKRGRSKETKGGKGKGGKDDGSRWLTFWARAREQQGAWGLEETL